MLTYPATLAGAAPGELPHHTGGAKCGTQIWTLLADEYPASQAAAAEIEAFDVIGRQIL